MLNISVINDESLGNYMFLHCYPVCTKWNWATVPPTGQKVPNPQAAMSNTPYISISNTQIMNPPICGDLLQSWGTLCSLLTDNPRLHILIQIDFWVNWNYIYCQCMVLAMFLLMFFFSCSSVSCVKMRKFHGTLDLFFCFWLEKKSIQFFYKLLSEIDEKALGQILKSQY